MVAETTPQYEGPENRSLGRTKGIYTREQELALIAKERFGETRPANLAYPVTKFVEDGKEGKTVATAGADLRRDLTRIFDRLEGKVDTAKLEALKASFEASLAPWETAGLFSKERIARGYCRPDFDRDYKSLITLADTEMMEAGEGLDKGYSRPVWAPEDVPVASEDAETLTYLKLAEEALTKAYHGTVGGKKPNTLLVGPEKRVLSADKIDLENILWQWERYKQPGVVYNPREIDPENHGGQSEVEMLTALKGTEKATGGVLRLERDSLIMPKDVGQETMSAQDWHALIKAGQLPAGVRAQDAKQALAYVINCLNTQGWIPDCYDWDDTSNSRVALASETYIPDESMPGAVPAFYWIMHHARFYADRRNAGYRDTDSGVRGGVRKNNA